MSQQTGAQARVVNPVLTTAARGYKNPQGVGEFLFPRVEVPLRGGNLIEFDRTAMKKFSTARAPGASVKRVQVGYVGKEYALIDHALAADVPDELRDEAMNEPGIDLGMKGMTDVMEALTLEQEREQATIATTSANYTASHVETLAGNSRWSHDDTDPSKDIAEAIGAIREDSGVRPNTVILGGTVYDEGVKLNPQIVDRIKHTGRDSVTPELLATLWNVERVAIGDCITFSDDEQTTEDVWGKNVIVAYTRVGDVNSSGQPSFGYTYTLAGTPVMMMPWRDNDRLSWVYPGTMTYKPAIVGKDQGYLLKSVVD